MDFYTLPKLNFPRPNSKKGLTRKLGGVQAHFPLQHCIQSSNKDNCLETQKGPFKDYLKGAVRFSIGQTNT